MANDSKNPMDLLRLSFQAIEHPELFYNTSRELKKAAYCSALGFLVTIAAIEISSGNASLLLVVTIVSIMILELLSLVFLASGFLKIMMVERDRKQNGVIFANSVLEQQSDEAIANFRKYNIRVIRTHSPGSYWPYVILTIMGVSLFILQIVVDMSGAVSIGNMVSLFGVMDESPFSLVTFIAIIILGTGIFELGFRILSDIGVKRWQSKSKTQILIDAENLISTYSKGITTTYEEGAKLLEDAEIGDPEAVEQTQIMADGMEREINRFKKIRLAYCLAIILLSIIDIIFILLP